MRALPAASVVVAALTLATGSPRIALAGGTEDCRVGGSGSSQASSFAATPYRSGTLGADLRYREVEFLWDATYTATITGPVGSTLDRFATTLAETFGTSPLVTDARNTEALYRYLNRAGRSWSTNPAVFDLSMQLGFPTYPALDYSHLDAYLTNPLTTGGGGRHPANLTNDAEDISSGHVAGDVLPENSARAQGPDPSSMIDLDGTGWTAPGSLPFVTLNHELQHALVPRYLFGNAMTEMLSAAAEAVVGINNSETISEVPYTWSLLAWADPGGLAPSPTDPGFSTRYSWNNYQARTSFMCYVAYNFLNGNPARTLAGMQDDLLYKWVHGGDVTSLLPLAAKLSDAECSDCAAKGYFRPGGVPLDVVARLQVLHHNWRVANFVNNSALAEGQYGFSAFGGFSPVQSQRAWQNIDGFTNDDIVALPAIITLNSAALTREASFQGVRTFRGQTHPLRLVPLSANYWVIRPDPSLTSADRDLVVRISPRSFYKSGTFLTLGGSDVRLMASAVAYNQFDTSGETSNLFNMPAAAVYATPAKWVDCDGLAGEIELVIPNFGITHKAAVVVISLGDGPTSDFSERDAIGYIEAMPYRLDLSIRSNPAQSQQPALVSAASSQPDDWPTWAPGSDELAYSAYAPSVAPFFQIYRRKLDGSPAARVAPQAVAQYSPDWSPRGDFIVYEIRPEAEQSDLYLVGTGSGPQSPTQLTSMPGCELLPTFQPNGQGVAYFYTLGAGQPWSLRWIGASGSGDRLVAANVTPSGTPPRWTSDGQFIVVYDATTRKLLRYPIGGGAPQDDPAGALDLDSFDLHPGLGRLLLSSSSPLLNTSEEYPEYGLPGPITSRRLALMDTTPATRDTAFRFVVRNTQSSNPRWSPDGGSVAFSRSFDGTVDRDVFAGRITWNRAPAFNSLMGDKGIAACIPFQLALQAADPDGEAVAYMADYLPSGSQIINGNTFRWQHPSVGEYFVVFRALDGSGGVDRRVIRISVADEGDCGDPLLEGDGGCGACLRAGDGSFAAGSMAMLEANASAPANSFLSGAFPGARVTQTARLSRVDADANGIASTSLRAPLPGVTAIDRVRVHVVDHPTDAQAISTTAGIVVGRLQELDRVVDSGGRDVLAALEAARSIGQAVDLAAGTILAASWSETDHISGLALECALGGVPGTGSEVGIEVQVRDGAGWRWVDHVRTRRGFDILGSLLPETRQARLVLLSDLRLRAISGLATSRALESDYSHEVIAVSASDQDVSLLVEADSRMARLGQGAQILLGFAPSPPPTEWARAYFLELTASYTPSVGAWSQQSASTPGPIPTGFALLQNLPNPFSGSTAFQFEVPRTAHVRIDVFDPLGRRVRTVLDAPLDPGSRAITWDGRDDRGERLDPGVYLYRMLSGAFRAEKRLVLLPR